MAQENELLIRINANSKAVSDEFKKVSSETEDLQVQLNKIAKVGAVAFAAFTAEIGLSVKAYAEAEAAARSLTQTLQTQGLAGERVAITTKNGEEAIVSITEAYKSYAEQVQAATGIDDDALTKAQAVAQSYLGQTKITKELTQAIADYSTKTGDVSSAAEAIARTIGTQTNAFARQGLVLSDTATRAERTAAVMEFVQKRFGGAAEAANQGLGSIRGLETAFGNFQETIGKRFAPFVEAAAKSLTRLFDFLSENEIVGDIAAGFLAFGAALGAVAVALPLIANAFLIARAAMTAFGIASNLALGGIPIAIGLITGAIAFVAVNWGKNLALMQAALAGFTAFAKEAIGGLAQVLIGAFNLDVNQVKEGLSKITNAYKVAAKEANDAYVVEGQKSEEKQDAQKKAFADKIAKREREEQARRIALKKSEDELIQLQLQNASDQAIDLKRQEIAVLKQLDTEKNAETLALLEERRAQILELENQQRVEDLERKAAFQAEDDAINAEIAQRGIDAKAVLRQQDQAALENALLTERETERKVALEIAQDRIKNRNLELEDRKKYGVAVSTVNAALRSDEVQGAKAVSGELVSLAQSKNDTLKAIGKAAAIAQITIATAESVVTIGQQVPRVIPFPFSIPVIAALVGARIAFGAEQIGNVRSAAQGGIVTGGIPGKDSVLVNAMPGELIVPAPLAPTFLDLVGNQAGSDTTQGADAGLAGILAGISQKLDGEFQLRLAAGLFESEVFVDGVISKINDRLENGNAILVGVNA